MHALFTELHAQPGSQSSCNILSAMQPNNNNNNNNNNKQESHRLYHPTTIIQQTPTSQGSPPESLSAASFVRVFSSILFRGSRDSVREPRARHPTSERGLRVVNSRSTEDEVDGACGGNQKRDAREKHE